MKFENSNFRLIKFEFSFEVLAIRFVTAVSDVYLTSDTVYITVCQSGQ